MRLHLDGEVTPTRCEKHIRLRPHAAAVDIAYRITNLDSVEELAQRFADLRDGTYLKAAEWERIVRPKPASPRAAR